MSRRLRENKACQIPTKHLIFDCETLPVAHPTRANRQVHILRLGVCAAFRWDRGKVSRRTTHTFTSGEEFWDLVDRYAEPKKSLWIWAHNLGFDLTATRMWDAFDAQRFTLFPALQSPAREGEQPRRTGLLVTQDPPTIVQFRTQRAALVTAVDTLNYLCKPLSDIGEMVGLLKLPMPAWQAEDREWENYCSNDVEILERFVLGLLRTVRECDLGNLRFSAAGQGYAAWRHSKPTPVVDFCQSAEVKADERLAYYGARVWVHFAGKVLTEDRVDPHCGPDDADVVPTMTSGPVYRLDMNSQYPFVMEREMYPSRYLKTVHNWDVARLMQAMKGVCVVAQVSIETDRVPFPCRRSGRTAWVLGKFTTWLCGPELLRALKLGAVRQVYKAHLYSADRIFAPFAQRLLQARENARIAGDSVRASLCKVFANALHGKLAQRPVQWAHVPGAVPPMDWGTWCKWDADAQIARTFRAIAGQVQERHQGGEREESFPAISAYVTAFAREEMRKAIACAGPYNALYEDADSLHVTDAGLKALQAHNWVHPTRPGAFKLVGTALSSHYRGLKDYRFGEMEIVAGLSGEAIEASPHLFRALRFIGLNGLLGAGAPQGPLVDVVTRERPHGSIPGRILPTGFVEPRWVED